MKFTHLGRGEEAKMLEEVNILRIAEGEASARKDVVVKEFPLTIVLNDQEIVTLLCSPADLKYLAVGFLHSEGLIREKKDIKRIDLDEQRGVAQVWTRGGKEAVSQVLPLRIKAAGGGRTAFLQSSEAPARIESELKISPQEVFNLASEFQHRSEIYRATGGTHAAALCNHQDILAFAEDIGRHNAVDKVFGQCLLEGLLTQDRVFITSGRISSEILLKVAKRRVPILISISAPTDMAVRLASEVNLTLIGFARGRRMNVYAGEKRITLFQPSGG